MAFVFSSTSLKVALGLGASPSSGKLYPLFQRERYWTCVLANGICLKRLLSAWASTTWPNLSVLCYPESYKAPSLLISRAYSAERVGYVPLLSTYISLETRLQEHQTDDSGGLYHCYRFSYFLYFAWLRVSALVNDVWSGVDLANSQIAQTLFPNFGSNTDTSVSLHNDPFNGFSSGWKLPRDCGSAWAPTGPQTSDWHHSEEFLPLLHLLAALGDC